MSDNCDSATLLSLPSSKSLLATTTRRTPELPDEMVEEEVLSRLPVKSLLRFKNVSKEWRSWIDSPFFLNSYFLRNRQSNIFVLLGVESGSYRTQIKLKFAEVDLLNCSNVFPFQSYFIPVSSQKDAEEKVQVLGSCNGLICVSTHRFKEIFMVNPSTREYKMFPPIKIPRFRSWHAGFGYVSSADEYKVLLMSRRGYIIHICGSKSNTWRDLKRAPECTSDRLPYYGKYTNGALHWIVRRGGSTFSISAFDLVKEKFILTEYHYELFGNPQSLSLEVLGEQLCLCCGDRFSESNMDIWVMKKYGVRESWTKLVSVQRYVTPLAFSNCGKHLLCKVYGGSSCTCSLHWYDLEKKSAECTNTPNNQFSYYYVCPPSLYSPW